MRIGYASLPSASHEHDGSGGAADVDYDYTSENGFTFTYEEYHSPEVSGVVTLRSFALEVEGGQQDIGDWGELGIGMRRYFHTDAARERFQLYVSAEMLAMVVGLDGDDAWAWGLAVGTGLMTWVTADFVLDAQVRTYAGSEFSDFLGFGLNGYTYELAAGWWF